MLGIGKLPSSLEFRYANGGTVAVVRATRGSREEGWRWRRGGRMAAVDQDQLSLFLVPHPWKMGAGRRALQCQSARGQPLANDASFLWRTHQMILSLFAAAPAAPTLIPLLEALASLFMSTNPTTCRHMIASTNFTERRERSNTRRK